mgnify:CR=1 FL=1
MTVYETLHEDLKAAMKSGDALRRDTIRSVESALKNHAIELRKSVTELSDSESISILRRLTKQRRESAESYREGNREDLASQEEAELSIIESYLPPALSDEELRALVAAAKKEVSATTKADFGKLMGAALKKAEGRTDGTAIKPFVEEALSTDA